MNRGDIMFSQVTLSFEGNSLTIRDFRYFREDPPYYNVSFSLSARSGAFAGEAVACEYHMSEFRRFMDDLSDVYAFRKPTAVLQEICGNRVSFEMAKTGHVKISGEIGDDVRDNCLHFCFFADQTALKPFIDGLMRLVEE